MMTIRRMFPTRIRKPSKVLMTVFAVKISPILLVVTVVVLFISDIFCVVSQRVAFFLGCRVVNDRVPKKVRMDLGTHSEIGVS